MTTIACKECLKQYSPKQTEEILSKIPKISHFDYSGTCLKCIQIKSQEMTRTKYPELREAKQKLDKITKIYTARYNKWKLLTKTFKEHDYQANLIKHLLIPKAVIKKPAKTKVDKTPDQTNKEKALEIMSSLTTEQREVIMANIAKQATTS